MAGIEHIINSNKFCPWTEQDKKEIRQLIFRELLTGMIYTRQSMWKRVLEEYPIDTDAVVDTLREFAKIYYSVQKEIKENTDTEKDLIVGKSIERLEELYKLAMEQKRYRDAKNVVDSLVKLVGVSKVQDMMKANDNGEIEFHLDFGL